jgi:hypothetical protein
MTVSASEWMTQEAPSSHKKLRYREQRSCDLTVDDVEIDDVEYFMVLPLDILCLLHIVGCYNSFSCIRSSLHDCVY